MAVYSWATGGASAATGPSQSFLRMPYRGYREWGTNNLRAWMEEFLDGAGMQFDISDALFINTAARTNLLDPAYTPAYAPTENLATAHAAPTGATVQHTMLDILLYIAGIPWPANGNLTVAQKQSLIQLGWDALKRKGVRSRLLRLASIYGDGVAYGATALPYNFGIMLPDGSPTPGYGSWVRPTAVLSALERPWSLLAARDHEFARAAPAWVTTGVGYSQFRAGYSAVGEPVFPSGARINLLRNEHFGAWPGAAPDNWTKSGTGTLTRNGSDGNINWEFGIYCAEYDLTAAANGVEVTLEGVVRNSVSDSVCVNVEYTHRLEIDYKYRQASAPFLDKLWWSLVDGTNTYNYNATTGTWSAYSGSPYRNPLPVSATTSTRTRYATTLSLNRISSTAQVFGTEVVSLIIGATSDGTASSQLSYKVYRAALYEVFDADIEDEAGGDRTLWLPLHDNPGRSNPSRTAGRQVIEYANATRALYHFRANTASVYPYHPALSGRGYLSNRTWTNLILGSNDFGADWTLTNATRTANAETSPQVGSPTDAVRLTKTTAAGNIRQNVVGALGANASYVAGVWVKKVSGSFTDVTLTLSAVGGVSTFSRVFTLPSSGWFLCAMEPFSAAAGDAGFPLRFTIDFASGVNGAQVAVASSYCYLLPSSNTSPTAIRYPPICQTAVGATGAVGATQSFAKVSGLGPPRDVITERSLVSLSRGQVNLTVVPIFGATGIQTSAILEFGRAGFAANSFGIYTGAAGTVTAILTDNGGVPRGCQLNVSESIDPAAGTATWIRDTEIEIRCRWDVTTGIWLSAGNGNAKATGSLPWTVSDALIDTIAIGNNMAGGQPFDGLIRDIEFIQIG